MCILINHYYYYYYCYYYKTHLNIHGVHPRETARNAGTGNGRKCLSSESISLKSHRNITTRTFIAYTPGQTSTSCDKIVWISLKRMYGEYLFLLEKYFCHFPYLAPTNMYLLVCRFDLWKYELQCRLQLICLTATYVLKQVKKESLHFYLCSLFLKSDTH